MLVYLILSLPSLSNVRLYAINLNLPVTISQLKKKKKIRKPAFLYPFSPSLSFTTAKNKVMDAPFFLQY